MRAARSDAAGPNLTPSRCEGKRAKGRGQFQVAILARYNSEAVVPPFPAEQIMLPRVLEPEVMDSADEAHDYDAMDHAAVNETFVDDLLAAARRLGFDRRLQDAARPLELLDCGTGTALIPIALCGRAVQVRVTAVDLAEEMLKVAQRNVEAAGLQSVVELRRADCKRLPFGGASFEAVMSNSIIHHLPEPKPALAEMARVLRPGGLLFVRDLLRPDSESQVEELVEAYAGRENERQKAMFRDSLRAALTLDEVRARLRELGLSDLVEQTSDRHWTIAGRLDAI